MSSLFGSNSTPVGIAPTLASAPGTPYRQVVATSAGGVPGGLEGTAPGAGGSPALPNLPGIELPAIPALPTIPTIAAPTGTSGIPAIPNISTPTLGSPSAALPAPPTLSGPAVMPSMSSRAVTNAGTSAQQQVQNRNGRASTMLTTKRPRPSRAIPTLASQPTPNTQRTLG